MTWAARSDDADAEVPSSWLTSVRRQRTFEVLLEQLERALLSGQLKAGDRLMPERDIAAALGVSRATVREALRVLEALGMVDVRRGPNGVSLRREPSDAFVTILRMNLALGHFEPSAVVELRYIVESWAFAEAADTRPPELLDQLELLTQEMAQPALDLEEFHALDRQFHWSVIDACGNELATMVVNGLRAAIDQDMMESIASDVDVEDAERLVGEHMKLYQLVRDGDAAGARAFTRHHILGASSRRLQGHRT